MSVLVCSLECLKPHPLILSLLSLRILERDLGEKVGRICVLMWGEGDEGAEDNAQKSDLGTDD